MTRAMLNLLRRMRSSIFQPCQTQTQSNLTHQSYHLFSRIAPCDIQYTQGIMKENVFEKDVLSNDVGDIELKSIDGIGIGRMTNREIKKDDKGMLKEPKKEWKLNKKQVMEEDA
ncbi:hypothetical protein Tco_0270889 [Tanacetum coccineum]